MKIFLKNLNKNKYKIKRITYRSMHSFVGNKTIGTTLIYVSKSTLVTTFKRTMMRSSIDASGRFVTTLLHKPSGLTILKNHYPGEYSAGYFGYNTVRGNGKKLPSHEYGHQHIRRNSDGTVVGSLTTDPKPSFDSELLNDKEYINGKQIPPDAESGTGQHVSKFKRSKIVEEPVEGTEKPIFKVNDKAQAYMDKNESRLKKIYDTHETSEKDVRVDKNDSRFYKENGHWDDDIFPKNK